MNIEQLVREFYNPIGEKEGRSSNLYYENNILYSYGHHYPVAIKVIDETGTHHKTLINIDDSTQSTSRHRSLAIKYGLNNTEVSMKLFKKEEIFHTCETMDSTKMRKLHLLSEDNTRNAIVFQLEKGRLDQTYISYEDSSKGLLKREFHLKKIDMDTIEAYPYVDIVLNQYLPQEVVEFKPNGKKIYKVDNLYFLEQDEEMFEELEENSSKGIENINEEYNATRVSEINGDKYVKGIVRPIDTSKITNVKLYEEEERNWFKVVEGRD